MDKAEQARINGQQGGRVKECKSAKRGRTQLKQKTYRFVQDWIDLEYQLAKSIRREVESVKEYEIMLQASDSGEERMHLRSCITASQTNIVRIGTELRVLLEGVAPYILPKHAVVPYTGREDEVTDLFKALYQLKSKHLDPEILAQAEAAVKQQEDEEEQAEVGAGLPASERLLTEEEAKEADGSGSIIRPDQESESGS